ncbi:hypothetical protein BHUM_05838 [Candidatus Burkholderia humilis]|nr:hypothetical protein BHUM_05838 [Candidatus Burkholderia humilis]
MTDYLADPIELQSEASDAPYRYERGTVSVEVIERTSANSAIVSWSDARFGRMGAQTWMAGKARVLGRCAMTGAIIQRGDRVSQPRKTRPAPINAGTMIVATYVHDVPLGRK